MFQILEGWTSDIHISQNTEIEPDLDWIIYVPVHIRLGCCIYPSLALPLHVMMGAL